MSTAPVGLFRHLSDGGSADTKKASNLKKATTTTSEQQLRRLEESSFQQQEALLKGELKGESGGEGRGSEGGEEGGRGRRGGRGGHVKKRSSTPTLFSKQRGSRAQSESFDFVNVSQLGEMNRKQLEALGLSMVDQERPSNMRERSGSSSSGGSTGNLLRERSGSGSSGGSGLTRRKSLE